MSLNQIYVINGFRQLQPSYVRKQEEILDWIASASSRAAQALAGPHEKEATDLEAVRKRTRKLLARFGCPPERIGYRGMELPDFTHERWEEMRIFDTLASLDGKATGRGLEDRLRFYSEAVEGIFGRFYAEETQAPADLIHVTCTGYISPSGAQRQVEKMGWENQTRVTHAYHMGCYAALPAVRIATGFASIPQEIARPSQSPSASARIDMVHTELCSLHFNPTHDTPEQRVVQSLFADGFIRYSVERNPANKSTSGLEIRGLREEIVPGSSNDMSWITSDWGFQMSLSREVPEKIGARLPGFLAQLCSDSGVDFEELRKEAVFAVHPGGPKIIDRVQDLMNLDRSQVAYSHKVLFEKGNMSSATLPHIWSEIVDDPAVKSGTWVVSLAFGPGLTISGGLFRKV